MSETKLELRAACMVAVADKFHNDDALTWKNAAADAVIKLALKEAEKVAVAAVNSCRESGETDLRGVRESVRYAIRDLI